MLNNPQILFWWTVPGTCIGIILKTKLCGENNLCHILTVCTAGVQEITHFSSYTPVAGIMCPVCNMSWTNLLCVQNNTTLFTWTVYYLYAHHVAYTVEPMTRTVIIYCLALNIWYKKLNFACRSEVGV